MKVSELITYLKEYTQPDDQVEVLHEYYDGDSIVSESQHPAIVVGYGDVIIAPDNYYSVKAAREYYKSFCTIRADGTIEE